MRVELIAKLIEAMDFNQFREFAHQIILQRGYKAVISDGWSDGGRDVRVYSAEGKIARQIAFQLSVEWEWSKKLWEDLVKAKEKLGCHDFVYVTNRRIGDSVYNPYELKALTDEEVHLSKIDNQDLAAHIIDTDRIAWFTNYLGITTAAVENSAASLRKEVADAFVLFSDEANNFRDKIAEHSIMIGLLREGSMDRSTLQDKAAKIMDYNDENRLNSAIDRLQQNGNIEFDNNIFSLSTKMSEHYNAVHKLADADRNSYHLALKECLTKYLIKGTNIQDAIVRVEELLGAIIRTYSDYQVALLKDSDSHDIRQDYTKQIHVLESAIHEIGVPLGKVKEAITEISNIASKHPVVTRLVAGDIFRRLIPCTQSTLLNALGRVRGVKAVLEPTVIIPLLCYKLYEDVSGNRHLRAARWFFQQAGSLNVTFIIPDVYVEECAVHLVTAGRYTNIMHKTPIEELAYSENAFVAFYSALTSLGHNVPNFKQFLEQFGFDANGDFNTRVDRVIARLSRVLKTYRIHVEPVSFFKANPRIWHVAQQDLSFIYRENYIEKPNILMKHDTKVLAYMRQMASGGTDAYLLTTWDHTLQEACRKDDYDWWCLDPLHAGDLMALVESGNTNGLGVDVSLLLDDAHLQMASKVWDTIVRIEQDKMFDADMMQKAVKFRKEFMAKQTSDHVAARRIAESWDRAKQDS